MFAGEAVDASLQATVDAVIEAASSGRPLDETDIEYLSVAWGEQSGGEWCADLVSLEAMRQSYEEEWLHEVPVDVDVIANNATAALVRHLAALAMSQHDPDDIGIFCHTIVNTDGDAWVLASFYSLELEPIGVFKTVEDAKAACVGRGYLVGNDGEDANHLASMSDDIIVRHFKIGAD